MLGKNIRHTKPMKFNLSKNPVVTLLAHFTGQSPDDFRYENGPEFRISKKPEVWKPFYLPVSTATAWGNLDRWGYAAPNEIEIDPDNLYYTDWTKIGLVFPMYADKKRPNPYGNVPNYGKPFKK